MKKTLLASAIGASMMLAIGSNSAMAMEEYDSSFSLLATQFDNKTNSSDDRTETFGARYTHSNKMYEYNGLIHDFSIQGEAGSEDNVDVSHYEASFDVGQRFEISETAFFDMIAGGGYDHYENEVDDGATTKFQTPYAKVGVGIGNHINEYNTVRLEAGVNYTIGGSMDIDGDDTDIRNKANSYVEATWANSSTGVPLEFGAYYKEVDMKLDVSGSPSAIDASQIGISAGLRF